MALCIDEIGERKKERKKDRLTPINFVLADELVEAAIIAGAFLAAAAKGSHDAEAAPLGVAVAREDAVLSRELDSLNKSCSADTECNHESQER